MILQIPGIIFFFILTIFTFLPDTTIEQEDRNLTLECANYFGDSLEIGKRVLNEDLLLKRTGKRFVLALLLPSNKSLPYSLYKVKAAVRLGIIEAKEKYLSSDIELDLLTEDTKCSEIYGPLNAVKLFIDAPNRPNVFLGPNCLYVISMVARFASSPIWSIPVISTDAQAKGFDVEKDYGLLIRLLGSYTKLGHFVEHFFRHFGWNVSGIMLTTNLNKRTQCYFMLSPVKSILDTAGFKITHLAFIEEPGSYSKHRGINDIQELLLEASLSARSNIVLFVTFFLYLKLNK